MKYKTRKEKYNLLYVVTNLSTNDVYIYKEITPLSELIGVDRSTIYRKFKKEGNIWSKNNFKVQLTTNIFLKSRRGK